MNVGEDGWYIYVGNYQSVLCNIAEDRGSSAAIFTYLIYPFTSIIIIIISIQPLGQFWQEPEPSQATGMALARCISKHVLRSSVPLLSPAFRRSHFHRQMPPRPQQREHS
jgi:hypothetical protein